MARKCSTCCRRLNLPESIARPVYVAATSLLYTAAMHSFASFLDHRPVALALRGLCKRFERPAVEALDLTVYGGEFYALVGPNGAGKTTTLRMVVGLLRPDAGSICIDGIDALYDPVSDEQMIYDKLSPYEYLEFVAGLWRIEPRTAELRTAELIEWLGLSPHAHERCEGFSKGMRQKVAL